MTLRRPWLWIVLAGCSWAPSLFAQTGAIPGQPALPGAAPAAGTTPTAPPALPTNPGATSGTTEEETPPPKKPPAQPAPTKPPTNPFGFGEPTPTDSGTTTTGPARPNNGASTTFGPATTETATTTEEGGSSGTKRKSGNETDFTAPGFYGAQRQSFTSGEGRFAKPKYRYGFSFGMGFDDNYQTAPDHSGSDPSEVVQVIPAQEEVAVFQIVRVAQRRPSTLPGSFPVTFRNELQKVVVRPFQPAQTIVTPIPGVPATPRASSVVTTANVFFNTQFAKARSALTFDLRLGAEYYWDRKSDTTDLNANISMLYLRKLSPRMQFTANASFVHTSQPDFSQVNVNNNRAGRSYSNGSLKFDLSNRWTPRFSTDTSVNLQTLLYDEDTGGNFYDITLGNEFRYIRSRKTTYVVEVRYGAARYLLSDALNSTTAFVLVGLDQRWSRRLSSTFRIGESLRSYDAGGPAQSSPYGEASVSYQPDSRSQVGLSTRYGFEQSNSATVETVVFRTSLSYSRALTPRLSGSAALNYVNTTNSDELSDLNTSETTTDGSLSLAYRVNRHLNLNAQLSYTMLKSSLGFSDYDRTRFFLTGSYEF